MYREEFKVAAVSDNSNSFGLKQCVLVARNGVAFKACKSAAFAPNSGDTVSIEVLQSGAHNFAGSSFEIPEQIENAPQEVLDELWG